MSQSVDTKIVELKFNNNNFEDKVDSTLSKLQNLNNSINEKGLSKSLFNLGKQAKNVDMSGITNGVEEATKGFSKLEVMGITALANITNSAVNLGKKLMSKLITPLTQGVMQGGLSRARNIEQATFQFEGQKISKSAGNESLSYYKEVMDAVLGTSYSYDVAAKAASQLAASNVGVIETQRKLADGSTITAKTLDSGMTKALLGIAGVAAMTGSDFDSISQIFTRVAGQGRVMANDLNSIASRGLNAAAVLANYLGKTEEEVRDMVSKGKVSFEDFSNAMSEAFGSHAKDSTLMFQGALDDVNAALARIGADFYGPALTAGRDILNSITPLVDAIHNKLNPALSETEGLMGRASKKLSQYFDMLSYMIERVDESGNDIGRKGMGGWIEEHMNAWTNIADLYKRGDLSKAVDELEHYSAAWKGMNGEGINGRQMIADYYGVASSVELLTKYLGKSDEEVNKLIEDGKIGADEINTVVDGMIKDGTVGFNEFYKSFHKLWSESEKLMNIGGITKLFDDYVRTCIRAEEPTERFTRHIDTFFSIIKGAQSLFNSTKKIFVGFLDIFMSLAQYLKPLGPMILGIVEAFANFVVQAADYIATSESFSSVISGIVALLGKLFDLINLNKTAPMLLAAITKTFDFLANAVERVHDGLAKVVNTFNSVMGKIIDKIHEIITNTELLREIFNDLKNAGIIIMVINLVGALTKPAQLIENIGKAIENLTKSTKGLLDKIGGMFKAIGDTWSSLKEVLDELRETLVKFQQLIVATAILEIAFAIAVLAGALYLLSKVNADGVEASTVALAQIFGLMVTLAGIAAYLKKSAVTKNKFWEKTSESIKDIAKAFLLMSISIAIMAAAIYALSKLDTDKMVVAFGVIEVLMFTMAGIAKFLSTTSTNDSGLKALWSGKSTTTQLTKGLYQLIFLAEAVKIVAKAITEIASITDPSALWNAVGVVELIMWSMAAIVKWLSGDKASKMAKGTLTLLAMALAIRMLTKPVAELAAISAENNDSLWSATIAIGVLMSAMALLTKMLSGTKGTIKAGIAILLMAESIKVLKDVVIAFSSLNAEAMWQAIIGIAAVLGSITLALALVDTEGLLSKAIAFVAVAYALGQLSEVVMMFSQDPEATWGGIITLGGALAVLAGACWLFSKVPIGGILKLFLTLALGAVIVAAFGAAIGVFGVGMVVFAAGLSAMADAMTNIKSVGDIFLTFMFGFVVAIGLLTTVGLPAVGVIVALGLAFLMLGGGFALLGSGLSNIAAAIQVMASFDKQLSSVAKNVVKFVKQLSKMDEDAEKVQTSTGAMADAITALGQSAKNAARNVGSVEAAGKKIPESFAKGMTSGYSAAESAAVNMVNKAVAKIRNNYNQWYSVGSYLIGGMVRGIASQQAALESQVKALEAKAERAVRAKAQIHSPSRVWMQIGSYMGEGLAIGIAKSSESVISASEGLASASEMAVSSAIESISNAISNDVNTNPVITPVMDLTNVRSGASFINSLLGPDLTGSHGTGLAASITHTIQNGGKSDMERSIDDLTDQIGTMTDTMNSRALNNYINVDGATDPEAFADGLIRSFRLNARTI